MQSSGNMNVNITSVKLKTFLIIAWCFLSINALPAHSSSNWEGPYVGGYIGHALAKSNFNTNVGTVTSTSYFTSTADILSVTQNGSKTRT